jgi:predicted RNA-binding Zn ribbon-like protein
MPEVSTPPPFQWVGGNVALDFTNTVSWRLEGYRNERFTTYEALVAWAVEAGVVDDPRPLLERAERSPRIATRVLAEALELRALLHDVLSASAQGRRAQAGRLRAFNRTLRKALGHLEVQVGGNGFGWSWTGSETDLERPLWPVVRAAAELLTSGDLPLVKNCANDRCGWLFVDRSRRGNRRWCEMRECGNRAKARRYYQRAKATRSG